IGDVARRGAVIGACGIDGVALSGPPTHQTGRWRLTRRRGRYALSEGAGVVNGLNFGVRQRAVINSQFVNEWFAELTVIGSDLCADVQRQVRSMQVNGGSALAIDYRLLNTIDVQGGIDISIPSDYRAMMPIGISDGAAAAPAIGEQEM